MNPEQQQIAIAEACGRVQRPDGFWFPIGKDYGSAGIPNYLNDLNAMHDAEKVLRKPMEGSDTDTIIGDRMHKYAELICYAFDATAAQRAEAFLRTIGKWKEAK